MQADRRRINPPAGGTAPPIYSFTGGHHTLLKRPTRTRQPDEHRKIFLRTGVVPSASGSAYYETAPQPSPSAKPTASLVPDSSSLKITCTVHGPRPLPRNAAFSPNLLLTTHVKFAPFATRTRRGYVRDASERDLGVHLDTALRGVVIGERWPKSACEVVITILEGEEDGWWGDGGNAGRQTGWGLMCALAGCITVASAALVDAGIDCVDMVSGGVAALVSDAIGERPRLLLDPSPAEHEIVHAACVVAYLRSRDEVTEVWLKGDSGQHAEDLLDHAVKAATLTQNVLAEAIEEVVGIKMAKQNLTTSAENGKPQRPSKDTPMAPG